MENYELEQNDKVEPSAVKKPQKKRNKTTGVDKAEKKLALRNELIAELKPQIEHEVTIRLEAELTPRLETQLKQKIESDLQADFDLELKQSKSELKQQLETEINLRLKAEQAVENSAELLQEQTTVDVLTTKEDVENTLKFQFETELKQQVETELRATIEVDLRKKLTSEIHNNLIIQIESELKPRYETEIKQKLEAEIRSELTKKLKMEFQSRADTQNIADNSTAQNQSEVIDSTTLNMDTKRIVEAILFAADKPMTAKQIQNVYPEIERPELSAIHNAVEFIISEYATRPVGLVQLASGYRFQVKEGYSYWVSRLFEEKPPKYSKAMLETMAIIAYRQPVTRGDIEDIRGVGVSSNIVRTLLEREWIRVIAHKEVPGRPALYGTTKQFLDYFNLSSLEQLPTLDEIKELNFSSQTPLTLTTPLQTEQSYTEDKPAKEQSSEEKSSEE